MNFLLDILKIIGLSAGAVVLCFWVAGVLDKRREERENEDDYFEGI